MDIKEMREAFYYEINIFLEYEEEQWLVYRNLLENM